MKSLKHGLLSIIVLPLFFFASPTISQPKFVYHSCEEEYGNYSTNSNYSRNLRKLLLSISSNTPNNYGFSNISVGQDLDKVHGMALCRGDLSMSECRSCIKAATSKITQDCHTQAAIILYQTCTLLYSSVNILSGIQYHPKISFLNDGKIVEVRDQMSFNRTISALLMRLAKEASMGDYRRKFATGDAKVEGNKTMRAYALVQCTPNLEEFDCFNNCLSVLVKDSLASFYGNQSVWVALASCSIRYDTYKFYNSTTVLPPMPNPSPRVPLPLSPPLTRANGHKGKKFRTVAIILIAAACLLLLILLACYYFRRTKKPVSKIENEDEDQTKTAESLQMDFGSVKAATENFSSHNILQHGEFGTIYKGTLSNGQAIAVKRLNKNSGQGKQEFKNEVVLTAKLQHKNLVRLLGFCIHKYERLLVYELLPNKSLNYFLSDQNQRIHLDWKKRYKIIQGIARGLLYLHEESRLLVVHRDLKPSNILLDLDMNPKISDFGMARLFLADQSHANTRNIIGTFGYMPPEYVLHGQFSIKSDVFSFGVLLLETVSGQTVSQFSQAENGESLLTVASRSWLQGNPLSLVDSSMSDVNTSEALRCIHIGLLCVQENPSQRPIMSSVALMLNSYTVTLPVPSRPAILAQNEAEIKAP